MIKEFGTAAALPIGDSALAALCQAGNQNTDFTMFRQAGYLNRHDLAGVVSHIASLDRSDSLGNRCVVVACNFGAGNGLATACHVVLRFAGGDRSRRRRLIALLLRQRWAGSGVVALALGTVPGAVVLVLGGLRLRGVLDIANGAAVVFQLVLAG